MSNKPESPQNKDGGNNNNNSPFANRNAQRLWLILGVVVLLVFIVIFGQPNSAPRGNRITLDQFARNIEQGNVTAITVRGGNDVYVELRNGTTAYYYKERETDLFQSLLTYGGSSEAISRIQFAE